MRALTGLLATATALAALGAACGGSDESSGPGDATPTTPPPAATDTGGTEPLEGAGTDPVIAAPQGVETALLERLEIARREGYDRVVFRFRSQLPGYRIEYADPPFREDGSGNRVEVAGNAFVLVRMEPASGFDLTVAEGELVYTGPRRIAGSQAGTSVVREVVRTSDFEGVLSWAVGLSDRVDFRVRTLEDPPRLVIDFRNH